MTASMQFTVLVFSAVRTLLKNSLVDTPPSADLFYVAIVYSIQHTNHNRILHLELRSRGLAQAHLRKTGKETTKLEARINSLKVLAQVLLREVEYLEAQDATGTSEVLDLQSAVHRFEAEMIRSALIRTGGRQRRAARLLGMKATTLNAKIRRYQIEKKEETP